MFNKINDIMNMKKQAAQLKRELDSQNILVDDVKGIKININGSQNFQSIEIDDDLIESGDKRELEMKILRSINSAVKKSQDVAAKKMKSVLPSIPGL